MSAAIRLAAVLGTSTLLGCTAILGISSGDYDPDPFGHDRSEAGPDATRGAPEGDAATEPDAEDGAAEREAAASDASPPPTLDAAPAPCGLLLDDLEDGDGQIIVCPGRNGTWYTHNDGTTGGTQTPAPNVPFLPVKPGYASVYSAYTKGSGFTSAGAEVGFHFIVDTKGPETYDLSGYTGITFRAKSSVASFTLYVNFPDKNTCPGATNCGDTYGKGETISTAWSLVTVPFTALGTDSSTPPHPFDAAQVYAVEFHAARDVTFEFWVDDVTLSK